MYEDREVLITRTFCICDRCGRQMDSGSHDGEWEERISISFRGGYFSEFGDGNLVEGDLCQHCIKELLGDWLRVTEDEPFDSKVEPAYEATRAFQEYQLREMSRNRTGLLQLFGCRSEPEKDRLGSSDIMSVAKETPAEDKPEQSSVERSLCQRAFEKHFSVRPEEPQWPQHADWWDCQFRLWTVAWFASLDHRMLDNIASDCKSMNGL